VSFRVRPWPRKNAGRLLGAARQKEKFADSRSELTGAKIFVYHGRARGTPVQPHPTDVERRHSELQAQIDRLSLALHQWRDSPENLQPMEQHLSQLTERCNEILNRWTETDERHTQAVTELEKRLRDWGEIENRLQQDSYQRIREFEQTIEHEWQALRQLHEEPVKQLREQAAALGETCVAAANLALRGFERAEARFAALEADLQNRMVELSRELHAALAELRGSAPRSTSLSAATAPFPLESVMRIHDQLRGPDEAARANLPAGAQRAVADAPAQAKAVPQLPEAAAALAERVESLERAVTTGKDEVKEAADRTESARRTSRVALVVIALAVVVGAALFFRMQRDVQAKLTDAATRVEAAERQSVKATDTAAQQIASTRQQAERQIADAQQTAQRAAVVSNVLAAPDLVRYNLVGGESAPRAYGQILWSRTRGLVFSASRLSAREGAVFQLWLVTPGAPVSAGLLAPDSAGRVTLSTDTPPRVPRPVIGAWVTVEPAGGSEAPTGVTVLTRPQ
jgi:hypothetical protein